MNTNNKLNKANTYKRLQEVLRNKALLKEFENKEPNEVSIFFNKYNKLIKD